MGSVPWPRNFRVGGQSVLSMYRQPAAPPKNRLPLLDRVAVKTPCKASWNDMEGDDRVRFCCSCSKNVYDLSAMTEDEAETFLSFHLDDQDACVKLYRRPDGRILTSDCPRGARTRHARRAVMAGAAAVCAVAAVAVVVGDVHVPRGHHRPRSTSRFEVPRPPPGAPRTTSSIDADEAMRARADALVRTWGVDDPAAGDATHAEWGEALGGLEMLDPVVPYGDQGRQRPKVHGPRVHVPTAGVTVIAGFPPEVVLRIVRQHFGRFRIAFEDGLKRNSALAGRIVVKFTIGPDGSVLQASEEGSSLPDAKVIQEVVRSFMSMEFPRPEGGAVIVTLPIDFAP